MSSVLCVYELDENGEANGRIQFFCSERCRNAYTLQTNEIAGDTTDAIEGTVCDTCGKELDV